MFGKAKLPKLLLVTAIAACSVKPATADDGTATQKLTAIPKAAAGVLAGLMIGVPVKIARDIKSETRRMAGTIRNDCGNEFGIMENVLVGGLSIPYGIASGLIMGGIRGSERAFTYGARQPFSRESLGLAEPEKPIAVGDSIQPAAQ